MPNVTPMPGEVWEISFKDGNENIADKATCFIYEKDGKLYATWFATPWDIKEVDEEMIDGQNLWRRVYSPAK